MATEQTTEITIDAPGERVWAVLADLEAVQDYDSYIVRASYVSAVREGIGAERQCDLADGTWLRERVSAWDDGRGYEIEVSEDQTEGFPLTEQRVRFDLMPRGNGTLVRMLYRYEYDADADLPHDEADAMALELIGGVLDGIKHLVETGEPVPAQVA